MTQTRFTCTLTTADEPPCQSYARVTITDAEGATARGCPRHAVSGGAPCCAARTAAMTADRALLTCADRQRLLERLAELREAPYGASSPLPVQGQCPHAPVGQSWRLAPSLPEPPHMQTTRRL